MNVTAYSTTTGQHETVESLIRYAASAFTTAGIEFPPSKMSKLIRREHRTRTGPKVRELIDTYLDEQIHARTWTGFELFTITGYADPTGARAAVNVDNARSVRARREAVTSR